MQLFVHCLLLKWFRTRRHNVYIYIRGRFRRTLNCECLCFVHVPSLCKEEGAFIFLQTNVLNNVFLTFVTIYLIWNPKPDKDNTCTTIHWGWHPLAYCVPPYFGLAYCVSPCFGLAYCVPFNNNNKTTIFGNFIYIQKIKWQYVACTCTIILANVKFGVFAC